MDIFATDGFEPATNAFVTELHSGSFFIGDWRVRPTLNRIEKSGETVQLEPRIMDVLVCLASHPGEVVRRDRLLETVWQGTVVGDDPLNRAVSELRKAFEDDPRRPRYIETIRKSGYRLIAPVRDDHRAHGESEKRQAFSGGGVNLRIVAALALALALVLVVATFWRVLDGRARAPIRPVQFTSFPGQESSPAFAPTGDRVAFSWGGRSGDNVDVYVKLLDSETPLRLTDNSRRDANASWSPDGQFIAFTRSSAESCSVHMISAQGGPERELATCAEPHRSTLSWSPDGTTLAYVDRTTAADPLRIHFLKLETLDSRPVTNPPDRAVGDSYPSLSPDGSRLAFVRTSISGVENIYVLPVGGGTARRITDDSQRIAGVAWLNDSEIVYASDRDGRYSLWRLRATGGEPEWLLADGGGVLAPSVDRTSGRLIYARLMLDKNIWQVSLARPESTAGPLISSTLWDLGPAFAPMDPPRVAFMSNRTGSYEIWTADADGSDPMRVTDLGEGMVGAPSWSPDGEYLAFEALLNLNADIHVVRPTTGVQQRITFDSADDVSPSWSADGMWIYFASTRSGEWEVWKKPTAGGDAVRVTQGGGFAARESPDGSTLYFTMPDSSGIWRQPVDGGRATRLTDRLRTDDWANWAPTDAGIYFVDRDSLLRASISLLDPVTRTIDSLFTLGSSHVSNPGLSISHDGQNLAYVQVDRREGDLMMVSLE